MPACESVKAIKTPTANRLMSAFVFPPKVMSKMAASTASAMMPTEKASRSPRKENCLGKYWSRANREARRGKWAYLGSAEEVREPSTESWLIGKRRRKGQNKTRCVIMGV